MSSRLEQFVRDHREDFDSEEPEKKIWEKIKTDVDPRKKKQGLLARMGRIGWSAAAAVVLLAVGAIWFFRSQPVPQAPAIVKQTTEPHPVTPPPITTTPDSSAASHNEPTLANIRPKESTPKAVTELDNTMDEEMYHYAKLVEIKHNQLKVIEKDEPLLYRQFASDVNKLDSVYHNLQNQLPKNPNREQILEAMLQNLQLQMGLLNHQLDIIKQINHSKKTAYEKAYKDA